MPARYLRKKVAPFSRGHLLSLEDVEVSGDQLGMVR